jgi:hypothetical protein
MQPSTFKAEFARQGMLMPRVAQSALQWSAGVDEASLK